MHYIRSVSMLVILIKSHLLAVDRILRYLKGTRERGFLYPSSSSLQLQAYANANWAGCPDTRRSTTRWCMLLGKTPILCKCKKQTSVSKSKAKAEYRSMSSISSEIIWLRCLLREFGVFITSPAPLYADNTSVIKIAKNTVYHERTKNIEIDCHFIRQHVVSDKISLPYVSSYDQPADIFTKPLPWDRCNILSHMGPGISLFVWPRWDPQILWKSPMWNGIGIIQELYLNSNSESYVPCIQQDQACVLDLHRALSVD